MFSGIVEECAPVESFEAYGSGARLVVRAPFGAAAGESIAVSGCCLTVLSGTGSLGFDLSAETLSRTWFGRLVPGMQVNLERSLRLSDRLGGHLVSGHVDGVGRIVECEDVGDGGRLFEFEAPAPLSRYLLEKGSIAVDGISLTIVRPERTRFHAAVIPETLARTSLGRARPGDPVHLEADSIGKWIERLLLERGHPAETVLRTR